jgi:hypothetical protein
MSTHTVSSLGAPMTVTVECDDNGPGTKSLTLTVTQPSCTSGPQSATAVLTVTNTPLAPTVNTGSQPPVCTTTATGTVTATFTLPEGAAAGDSLFFSKPTTFTGCSASTGTGGVLARAMV